MLIRCGCPSDLNAVEAHAAWAERVGYDTVSSAEVAHDPFLPLALASRATRTIKVGTAIAVAFARTPMAMATITWDLHAMSRGRLVLGLGSQIRPHIERRFGMPWSHPAARMKEYIEALRAIWTTWETGAPLNFRGEFYQHTLMTPNFEPGKVGKPLPPIYVAGVGAKMVETAAEVADGLLLHSFSTRRYEEQVSVPMVEKVLTQTGRARSDFVITDAPFVVTGVDEESMKAADKAARAQTSFYASTPAYRPVLEAHGWGELQDELNVMSKRGQWTEMAGLITDDILSQFAVIAEPDQLGAALKARISGIADAVSFNAPPGFSDEQIAKILAELKA
jgi:probable F420-dependent oxidoreductase